MELQHLSKHLNKHLKFLRFIFFLVFTFFLNCINGQVVARADTISGKNKSAPAFEILCPLEGSAKTTKLKELNCLKNRTYFPKENNFDPAVNLGSLLKHGDDSERWKNTSAAKVKGYVKEVKPGGAETCNCKSKDRNLRDTHIELILEPMSAEKNQCLIIEITPGIRKIMAAKGEDWSTSAIRSKYLGRWVEVEGWLLYDFEHANMAENTRSGNTKNWRGTAWEIHPVTSIKIAEKN